MSNSNSGNKSANFPKSNIKPMIEKKDPPLIHEIVPNSKTPTETPRVRFQQNIFSPDASKKSEKSQYSIDPFNAANDSMISAVDTSFSKNNLGQLLDKEIEKTFTPRIKKMLEKTPKISTKNMLGLYNNIESDSPRILNQAFIQETPRSDYEPTPSLRAVISEIAGEDFLNTLENDDFLEKLDKQIMISDLQKKDIQIEELNRLNEELRQEWYEKNTILSQENKQLNDRIRELTNENDRLSLRKNENEILYEQRISNLERTIEHYKIDIETINERNRDIEERLTSEIDELEKKLRERSSRYVQRQDIESFSGEAKTLNQDLVGQLEDLLLRNRQCEESLIEKNQELALDRQTLAGVQQELANEREKRKKDTEILATYEQRNKVLQAETRTLNSQVDMLKKNQIYFPQNISKTISELQRKIQETDKITNDIIQKIESAKISEEQAILYFQKNIEKLSTELKALKHNCTILDSNVSEIIVNSDNIRIFETNRFYLQYAMGELSQTQVQEKISQFGSKYDESTISRLNKRMNFPSDLSEYILSELVNAPKKIEPENAQTSLLVQRIEKLKQSEVQRVEVQADLEVFRNLVDHILFGAPIGAWAADNPKYTKMAIHAENLMSKVANCEEHKKDIANKKREYENLKREYEHLQRECGKKNADKQYFSNILFLCYRFFSNSVSNENSFLQEIKKLQKDLKPTQDTIEKVNIIIDFYKNTKIRYHENDKIYKEMAERNKDVQRKYKSILDQFNARAADFASVEKINIELDTQKNKNKILEEKINSLNKNISECGLEKDQLLNIIQDLKYELNNKNLLIIEAQVEIRILQSVTQKYGEELQKMYSISKSEEKCREKYKELRTSCMRKVELANEKIRQLNGLKKEHASTLSLQAKTKAYDMIHNQKLIESMKKQYDEYERVIGFMKDKLKKTDLRLKILRLENQKLREQISVIRKKKTEENSGGPTKINTINKELKIATLEDELIDLQNAIKENLSTIKNRDTQILDMETVNQEQLEENHKQRTKITEHENTILELQQQIHMIQKDLENKKKEIISQNTIIQDFRKQLEINSYQLKGCSPIIANLQRTVDEKTTGYKDLETEINKLKIANKSFGETIVLLERANIELKNSMAQQSDIHKETLRLRDTAFKQLEQDYNSEKDKYERLNAELENINNELRDKTELYDKKEKECTVVLSKNAELSAENTTIKDMNSLLENRLKRVLEQHKIIVAKFKEEILSQNKSMINMESDMYKMTSNLKKQSSELHASKSYIYPKENSKKLNEKSTSTSPLAASKSYILGKFGKFS